MDFLPPAIEAYVAAHSEPENRLLQKIHRDTYAQVLMPRMLSGHLQGRTLAMLCSMIKPYNILEIGTFTGYSALCMAEHLDEGGKLVTIDINEELEDLVRGYFQASGKSGSIEYIIGNALEIVPGLTKTFDLVFIDADKINYPAYYDIVFEKVAKGGYIIADNVLWSGKVANYDPTKKDKDLQAILAYNQKVQEDTRVANVLFPIRDGLMIARKL